MWPTLPMKTAVLDREIRVRIDSFLGELSDLVKIAALEAVHDALDANLASEGRDSAARSATPRAKGRKRARRSIAR
jgi:hypothetical protein